MDDATSRIAANEKRDMKVTGRIPTTLGPRTLVAQGLTEDTADLLADLVRRSDGHAVIERDGPRVVYEEWLARQRTREKRAKTRAARNPKPKSKRVTQPDLLRLTVVRNS
jgi:hypothetical protein